jgi:peptidoglycan/LPS O-acetylase OafA/YrhL
MSKSSNPLDADVPRWMASLAAEKSANAPLPDPHLVWLKAQLEERREQRERALRPIAIAQKVAVVLLTLLGVAVLMAAVPLVENWSGRLGEPEMFAWAVAAVCLIAVGYAFVLKPLIADD